MAATDLTVNIIGNAKSAVDAFNQTGDAAENQVGKFDKMKAGITIATGLLVAGVAKFAGDSVSAYAEAEQSQAQLVAAYEKFPGVANVSIDALRTLNSEIQKKTGFDDDELAASQATLAQFGLTGDQIQQLTPLMADYAAKTGKDLTTAAEDMGKAVMGQGKALKSVGVEFSDSGSAAGNFDQLIGGLDGTVGGFAETMGGTAAGKAKILETSFGDIQETVGEMLMPALSALVDIGTKVTQWLSDNPAMVQVLAIGLGVLAAGFIIASIAVWAMNSAMLANPITWIILAVVALIAAIVLLVMNWDTVVAWITEVWGGFIGWITGVIDGFIGWWNGVWSGFATWIGQVWQGFISFIQQAWFNFGAWLLAAVQGIASWWNSIWSGIGSFISGIWNGIVSAVQNAINWVVNVVQIGLALLQSGWNSVWNGLSGVVRGIWNGILGFIERGVNGAIGIINDMINAVNSVSAVVGVSIGTVPTVNLPRLATGTVTNGPMLAMIGDNPGGREVVQPVSTYQDELRRAYTSGQKNGGGSGPVVLEFHGDSAALEQLFTIFQRKSDGERLLVQKQGKRRFS